MAMNPNPAAEPWMQRGAACYGQRNLIGAKEAFRAASMAQPELVTAKFNLGVVCRDLEENLEARDWFEQVLESGEIDADAYNNLGILAVRDERFDDGLKLFRHAIRIRHQFPLAHFNLGALLMRMGAWDEGFREYEWRWQTPGFQPLECPHPQWDGQPLDGTLLLHTEQGIGDVFQFARFIPEIRRRCKRVIFVRPESLACMFPDGVWGDEVRSPGDIDLDAFQAVLPLMSAPFALQLDMSCLPLAERYLTPVEREIDLGPPHGSNPVLKVGFSWCGSPTYVNDRFRSMILEPWRPLFRSPNVAFYSLQLGDRVHELDEICRQFDAVRDLSGIQEDFADTAAIARQMDLLISVDTSILHLGGAMGIPTWGLLSRRTDWRWLSDDRPDSPWYPTVRLYRQRQLGHWDEVMQRVVADLSDLVAQQV